MTLQNGIDTIHYAILHVVEKPLWKKKIHDALRDVEYLPIDSVPSIQTVGRRVDELHEAEYLTTSIISPDDVDRDLIIGYKRTKDGDKALAKKRDEMLQELARTSSNAASEPQRTVPKPALIKLISEQFDLDTDTTTRMNKHYDEQTLFSLLALHYAQKNADKNTESNQFYTDNTDDAQNFQSLLNK